MPVDTRPAVGLLVVVYYLPQDHQSPGINRCWHQHRISSYCPFLYITCPDASGMVYVCGRAPYSRFPASSTSATSYLPDFLRVLSAHTLDGILSKNLFVEHGHSEPLAYLLRRAGHISSTLAGWTVAAPVNPQT